jgi:hypothetical protein
LAYQRFLQKAADIIFVEDLDESCFLIVYKKKGEGKERERKGERRKKKKPAEMEIIIKKKVKKVYEYNIVNI